MTIHEALRAEVGNLTRRFRYEYSTEDLANATIFDGLLAGDFPVCLVLPFDINDTRENGVVTSSAEINAMFLDRAPQSTMDKPIQEAEDEIIAPMRTYTREFLNRMDLNDIVHEEGVGEATHRSVHEPVMDAHVYGNWAVFTIKFTEDLSQCI